VTVLDAPPVISGPGSIIAPLADDECSSAVEYLVTATDNCDGVTVVTEPPSGSIFELGTTEVVTTATDSAGNETVYTFPVTVTRQRNVDVSEFETSDDHGFRIDGEARSFSSGGSAAFAGDLDGDGYGDLVIGK